MKIDIMTLFPDMFKSVFGESIIGRDVKKGILDINYINIRDFAEGTYKKVDDYPYGGGFGLIMMYKPIYDAWQSITQNLDYRPYCVYMSPQGKVFNHTEAKRLSEKKHLVVLCGHYEGVDDRILEEIADEEISIGDYVLTGGELPAMVLVDTVSRLVPDVLKEVAATEEESHSNGLLEYPQYTRPVEINNKRVPEILLTGNHSEVDRWREEMSYKRTFERRKDMLEVYLDNSATTKQTDIVTAEIERVSNLLYGNPSSLHSLGFEAEKELKRSRQVIAHKLGVQEKEIVFTSSGTEANNLAMFGFLQANPRAGKHILISAIEHPSVLEPAKVLAKMGYEVEFLKTGRNGIIDLNYLESCLSPDISFVSVMQVNNETGAIQPVEEIGKLIEKKAPGAVFHCDGVQGFGKIFLPDLPFKMYTASAHKIHGPRGAAFLYVKNGIKISPLLYGGGQESNLRSGTENLPAIAGFRAAVELAYESNELEYITTLNKYFRKELLKKIPKTFIISDKRVSSPYIIALSLPGTKAEVIQHMLESKNVFVSVGSACSSHKKGKSHVLLEMGLEGKVIDGAIRVSFSKFNTYDQLDYTINCMTEAVEKFSGV